MLINFAVITNGGPVAAAPGPPPSWRICCLNNEHDPEHNPLNHYAVDMAVVSRAHRGRKRLAHRARDAQGPPLHWIFPVIFNTHR